MKDLSSGSLSSPAAPRVLDSVQPERLREPGCRGYAPREPGQAGPLQVFPFFHIGHSVSAAAGQL